MRHQGACHSRSPGVGYGDSNIMDSGGEIVARSRRHEEEFIMADVDTTLGPAMAVGLTKSAWSFREFGAFLAEAAKDRQRAG